MLYSQAYSQRWNLRYKNSVDLIIGSDLGYRVIEANSNDQKVIDHLRFRRNVEEAKHNFRIGFNYNFALSEKLFLKSGLILST